MSHDDTKALWCEREELAEPKRRALSIIERWGTHATCFQLLEPGYEYWFDPEGEAVVGYVKRGRRWVVAGPPVAPAEASCEVTRRFLEHVRSQRGRAVFVSVEESWLEQVASCAGCEGWQRMPLGVQPEWELASYHVDTPRHKTLRSQVRRATRKGAAVEQIWPGEEEHGTREAVVEVVSRWLSDRSLSPLGFMVALAPYHLASHRRYWLASVDGDPVALLVAIPVPARNGWFIEDVVRCGKAPNGTIELLIVSAIQALRHEGGEYLTLGLSPLAQCAELETDRPGWRLFQRWIYHRLNGLYHFAGLYAFKRRFVPDRWTPQYLAVCGRLGLLDVVALIRALTGPATVRFFGDSVRRQWRLLSTPHKLLYALTFFMFITGFVLFFLWL